MYTNQISLFTSRLVVSASIAAFVNDVCILIAMADGRDIDTIAPALEEKVNGAIMLY